MKTSQKILYITAVLVFILLLSALFIWRARVQPLLQKAAKENEYNLVYQKEFKGLDFSADWKVIILQGKKFKVEIAQNAPKELQSKLQNIDGTLHFKTDTNYAPPKEGFLRARITAPSLSYIKSSGGAKIEIFEFQSDSLRVVMDQGGEFTGYNTQFKHIFLKTSGNAQIKFTDTN